MTTQYAESSPSLTSKSSKYHVYQTDGKPLSTEAIYRAKLKYGIYNNPAKVSLGVDPSASDTAAVLAANTDLSIHAYSKDLSAEAAHAALIAKPENVTAWKRTSVAPEAEYAAMSAKSLKYPFSQEEAGLTTSSSDHQSEGAAASVLKKPSQDLARNALQDLYDFDDIRSGKATLSQFSSSGKTSNVSSKPLKSLSSKKDYRSGIVTSNNAVERTRTMNIGNINKSATKTADDLMSSRLNPEKNFRSGIKTTSSSTLGTNKSKTDHSIYIKNIYAQSVKTSEMELKKERKRTMGLETPSDRGLSVQPQNFAASALKLDPSKQYNDDYSSTVKDNSLVPPSVYAIAAEKAKKQIAKMDDDAATKNLFSNVKANEIAYKVAQENAAKRRANETPVGSIRLGGGLTMKYGDIEQIASNLVKPAITDMESRVVEMRALDEEKKKLPGKIRAREAAHQEELRQAQLALEKKRAGEAKARRDQLVLDQQALDEEYEKIKEELAQKYSEREEEFDKQVEEQEGEKKEVDEERSQKLQVLNDTKAAADKERQDELDGMQAERDEEIAPLLNEHSEENDKLNELVSTREEKEAAYNEEKEKADALQTELDGTLSKIEIMDQRLAELEASLADVTEQEAVATSAAEEAEAKLNGEGSEKEGKISTLGQEREDLETKRAALHGEISTKAEGLKTIQQEHHVNEKDVNDLYPEHLRKEVAVPESFNDDDLSDSKFELDDSPIEIPPEVESEPEDVPEEVWPKIEEPEPEAEVFEDARDNVKAEPRKVVPKKTWEEIKASDHAEGGDPLANVPTQEKPAMADIVDDKKIKDSITATQQYKSTKPSAKTAITASSSAPKSGKKSKGLFGFFKSAKPERVVTSKTTTKPAAADKAVAQKKFKGLQTEETAKSTESATKATTSTENENKKEATTTTDTAVESKSAETPVVKKTEIPVAKDEVDEDVFSGFSQGSEVEETRN